MSGIAGIQGASRTIGLTVGIGAAVAVVGAAAWWLTHRDDDPEPTPTPSTPPATPPPPPPHPSTPAPVTDAKVAVTIGQLNAKNLFDTVDDPKKQDDVPTAAEHELHLAKLALTIRDTMGAPDVITLEEVENLDVLRELAARPELAGLGYVPVLQEGRDPRSIDVAMLYRGDRLRADAVTTWDPSSPSTSGRLTKTFTRPPLVVTLSPTAGATQARDGAQLTVVAAHLTSRLQGADGERRRGLQSAALAAGVDALVDADPAATVVVGGDLNMEPGEVPFEELVGPRDAQSGNRMLVALDALPLDDRFSYGTGSRRALFDHALVTSGARYAVGDARIPHINSTATKAQQADPRVANGSSDHDPVLVTLSR